MDTPYGELPPGWAEHGSMSEQHDFLQARLSRRALLKGFAATGVGAAVGPALWIRSARATGTPRLSRYTAFGADPQREAVVSFAAATPFRTAVVEYGTDDTFGMTAAVDLRTVRGVPTVYGHSPLQGLRPGTAYRYRVRLDDTLSAPATLTTAPAAAQPFTFTAFGDQGVSAAAQKIMLQLAHERPAFHLLAGDVCYADSSGSGTPRDHFDVTVWDTWLSMIEPVASTSAWMCATGNHDMEPGYGPLGYTGFLNRLAMPGNGVPACPSSYAFRYGDVGFVCLDSNDVSFEIPHNLGYSRGTQTGWLQQQLANLRAPGSGVDFVVVYFHHCAFSTNTKHGCDEGVRQEWVPLFDEHQVDLVINGHAHIYERTSPIRKGQPVAAAGRGARIDSRAGTTYITAGGGGRSGPGGFDTQGAFVVGQGAQRTQEAAPWALPTKSTKHSFLAVRVTPRGSTGAAPTMSIDAIDHHGKVIDQVTLERGSGALPAPSAPVPAAGSSDREVLWLAGSGAGAVAVAGATGGVLWRRARRNAMAAEQPESPAPEFSDDPGEPLRAKD